MGRDGEVSCAEGVVVVPPLRAKFSALCYAGMEETEGEQHGVELLLSRAHIQGVLRKKKSPQKNRCQGMHVKTHLTVKLFSAHLAEVVEGSV